jgi:N-acetylmuramoyl-L-alanine amidase
MAFFLTSLAHARRMRLRALDLMRASALICAALVCGCGSGAGLKAGSESALKQVRAENRVAQRRIEARTKRLARDISAANARDAQGAHDAATNGAASGRPNAAPKPAITPRFIPFGPRRQREMAAYAQRHYGIDDYRLRSPKVIVEHYTVSADAGSAINTFSADVPDPELHELPGVCSHFVIDRDGTIYQLVSLRIMCRHTVGLNYTAIGIEHAGFKANDILSDAAQLRASLALTRWLACRYRISMKNIIGHNESLSSPYHREQVARLRSQTHGDWTRAEMDIYRARLGSLPC